MKRITTLIGLMLTAVLMISGAAQANGKDKHKINRKAGAGIVAHRGFWNCEEAGYAQNSIASLRCAQEAGLWGSEMDVHMTKDEVLVVYHDDRINGKRIEEYPYSEFKDFKLRNGEPLPTLNDYLTQAKKYANTVLVYEIKPRSTKELEDRMIELTIKELKEHGMLNPKKVIFISFSYHMCKELAKKLPKFTVQYLSGNKTPAEVKENGINGIDYHFGTWANNPGWSQECLDLNMSRNAWTANSMEDIKTMYGIGMDQVTTDNPLVAREALKELNMKEWKVKVKKTGK